MSEELRILGLEKVIKELDTAMEDARYVCPYPEYAGMVRDDIVKEMAEYLNNLKNDYVFQHEYKVEYIKEK